MLRKKYILVLAFAILSVCGYSQTDPVDTIPLTDNSLAIDTSLDYDALFDDFFNFMDSLLAPRSHFLISISGANTYFNYKTNSGRINTKKQLAFTPIIGYYHKSGPGVTFSANYADYGEKRKWYQFFISPSFDFIQSRNWIGSISYVRYFTKDSLPFYTTPLQNEINAYFVWRKSWLEPGLAASYGWGSRSDVEKREGYIRLLLQRIGVIYTSSTTESIRDFSVIASLRHNFYWLDVFSKKDYFKFTPLITFSAGTQKYGFNQTSGTYAVKARNTGTVLYNSGNVNLDNELKFQPLSLTFYLRPEYNFGKFFIQPQAIFDYYFPAKENNLNILFSVNAGFMF